jgi:hypothetical protein
MVRQIRQGHLCAPFDYEFLPPTTGIGARYSQSAVEFDLYRKSLQREHTCATKYGLS